MTPDVQPESWARRLTETTKTSPEAARGPWLGLRRRQNNWSWMYLEMSLGPPSRNVDEKVTY